MPYRAVYTTKRSLCGDTYTEVNVVFDEVIDHEPLSEPSFQNDDTFGNGAPDEMASDDAYWDTIPF